MSSSHSFSVWCRQAYNAKSISGSPLAAAMIIHVAHEGLVAMMSIVALILSEASITDSTSGLEQGWSEFCSSVRRWARGFTAESRSAPAFRDSPGMRTPLCGYAVLAGCTTSPPAMVACCGVAVRTSHIPFRYSTSAVRSASWARTVFSVASSAAIRVLQSTPLLRPSKPQLTDTMRKSNTRQTWPMAIIWGGRGPEREREGDGDEERR